MVKKQRTWEIRLLRPAENVVAYMNRPPKCGPVRAIGGDKVVVTGTPSNHLLVRSVGYIGVRQEEAVHVAFYFYGKNYWLTKDYDDFEAVPLTWLLA